MKKAIQITGLKELPVLKDITMEIEENQFITISGSNNSGKTTLMRILNRDIIVTDSIEVEKKRIEEYSISDYTNFVQAVFPMEIIWNGETVEEELEYAPKNHKEEIMKGLHIKRFLSKEITSLSKEETILLQMAIALLKNPKILLLDNIGPYLGDYKYKVLLFLKKYQKNHKITILYTTLDLEDSLSSDYLYILSDGMVVLEGNPMDVLQQDNLIHKIGLKVPFMIDLSVKLKDYDLIERIETDPERLVDVLWK